jgi:hypothetical protein
MFARLQIEQQQFVLVLDHHEAPVGRPRMMLLLGEFRIDSDQRDLVVGVDPVRALLAAVEVEEPAFLCRLVVHTIPLVEGAVRIEWAGGQPAQVVPQLVTAKVECLL